MTTPVLEPHKVTTTEPIAHARCCKAALPKGLCRGGGPRDPASPITWDPECTLCLLIWESGHVLECPRDSGLWL